MSSKMQGTLGIATLSRDEGKDEHVVVFRLGSEHYGVDIDLVQEIVRMQPITILPEAGQWMAGIIKFRGNVVPVVDLRSSYTASAIEETIETRIVVMVLEDGRSYGLIVDAVSEVRRIGAGDIESAAGLVGHAGMVRGIAKLQDRLVALIDVKAIVPTGEFDLEVPEEEAVAA